MVNEAPSHPSSILSQATAQALEFPSLLAVVSVFAASDLGRERVLDLRRLAARAAPNSREVAILRGICRRTQRALER